MKVRIYQQQFTERVDLTGISRDVAELILSVFDNLVFPPGTPDDTVDEVIELANHLANAGVLSAYTIDQHYCIPDAITLRRYDHV